MLCSMGSISNKCFSIVVAYRFPNHKFHEVQPKDVLKVVLDSNEIVEHLKGTKRVKIILRE